MLFDDNKIKDAISRRLPSVSISGRADSSLVKSMVNKACRELGVDPNSMSFSISYKSGLLLTETIINISYHHSIEDIQINNTRNQYQQNNNNYHQETNNQQQNQSSDAESYYVIEDNGQTSLLSQLRLSTGHYKFEIRTRDPRSIASIIQKEQNKLLEAEEGINSFNYKMKGASNTFGFSFQVGPKSNSQAILFEYKLGMPYSQFIDHRKKGIEKSSSVFTQLTHGAKFPADVLSFLAFCYLQKNVKYNTEYVQNSVPRGKIEGDNHMAYGALVKKIAVCEGYAWAFVHILERGGYIAKVAFGKRQGGQHAWARVLVQGKWYNVDPTISYGGEAYMITNCLVSDNCLVKQGYQIDAHPETVCDDMKYENQQSLVNAIKNRKDEFIRQGGNETILNGSFVFAR